MDDGIEGQVRRIVARRLGVPARLLEPGASLREDLCGDVHTVRDLVLAVERRLGVQVESRLLDEVRSYGELVAATLDAIRARRARLRRDGAEATSARVHISNAQGLVVDRAEMLTPYALEAICDDARRAGAGATLAMTVVETATDEQIAGLRERLGALERLGVTVSIGRRPGKSG
jgi:acyl carrier protein